MLGSRGGVASRGVAGIGVGLTYSSSSADVVREKLTACAFRCGVVFSPVRKSVGTGVIGTTGSSCAPGRSGTFEVMSDYMLSRSPALLAPVEYHRARVPLDEELLVDNCLDKGDGGAGVRCENVDEPVQLDAGDVGDR